MRIERIRDEAISSGQRTAIAAYRYQVFVESLQWQLPCAVDYEQDEFDGASATHIVASEAASIVGYARLLPTTAEYLLEKHFAHLLNGAKPPKSPLIWELSRFTAGGRSNPDAEDPAAARTRVGKRLLLEALQHTVACGASQLLFCTTVAIERLAKRWGVDIHRAGRPVRSAAGLLVAATIDCTDRNVAAVTQSEPLRVPSSPLVFPWGRPCRPPSEHRRSPRGPADWGSP